MKTYNEMAQSVFARREKYNTERTAVIRKCVAIAACGCLVAALGVGAWYGNTAASTGTASEQRNDTAATNIAPYVGNEHKVDTTVWLSADEVLKSAENDTQQMGVAVPMLITYQGAVYGDFGEESNDNSRYARLETEVILRKNYAYSAYQIEGDSESVAIVINGRLEAYQKLFAVNVVVDGNAYRIVQPMMSGIDYSYGEMVQENEDFTVYQAIDLQSGEVVESEYVINILPLLKRELPNFFDGDENYGDAWWVAIPQML